MHEDHWGVTVTKVIKELGEQDGLQTQLGDRGFSFDNIDYSRYFMSAEGKPEEWGRLCAYVIRNETEEIDNYESHYHRHVVLFRKVYLIDLVERAYWSPDKSSEIIFPGKEIVDECIWEDACPLGQPVSTLLDIGMAVDISGNIPKWRLMYTRLETDLSHWKVSVFGEFPACKPKDW